MGLVDVPAVLDLAFDDEAIGENHLECFVRLAGLLMLLAKLVCDGWDAGE
jgi:hypothetical protein